jgi:hypothetical protein
MTTQNIFSWPPFDKKEKRKKKKEKRKRKRKPFLLGNE